MFTLSINGAAGVAEGTEVVKELAIEDIVRPEDLSKGKDWWRCKACGVFVHSEAHLQRCPYVSARIGILGY